MSNDVRDILLRIRDEAGTLTPPVVVGAARDEQHPLHHRFEWDDTIAGERFREHQASELIRSVNIQYTITGEPSEIRAFLSVRIGDTPDREYVPTEVAMADPFTSKLLLQEFDREWKRFKARYGRLVEFRDVVLASLSEDAA